MNGRTEREGRMGEERMERGGEMESLFCRSEKHVINRNLDSTSWLWMRRQYPRPGPANLHSSRGLAGEVGEPEGTQYMFLVPSLHLGTGLQAASLAPLRVWLQPSTSSRWQRLRDQRPIQQGTDQLTMCSGRRLLPKPASSRAGQASSGTKGIRTGPAPAHGSDARQVAGRCWVMAVVSSTHKVTPILCLNPLISPLLRGMKEEPSILPSSHFMHIHVTVACSL